MQEIIKKIEYICDNIYNNNVNIYKEINDFIPKLNSIYEEFIALVPGLNSVGLDISIDGLIQQLGALLSAIEKQDKVCLYDTLNYEIKDTILYYQEINNILNQ